MKIAGKPMTCDGIGSCPAVQGFGLMQLTLRKFVEPHAPMHRGFAAHISAGRARLLPHSRRQTAFQQGASHTRQKSWVQMAAAHRDGSAADWMFLDNFAFRQFEGGHAAQLQVDKETFMTQLHARCTQGDLVDGYAPFCKHLFVPNFAGARLNSIPITAENKHLLRSAYSQRRPEELAVLTRWFPSEKFPLQEAKFLDVILYSRDQLIQEHDELPEKGVSEKLPDAPWGVISIKPQDEDFETPMQPITIMRNSLGQNEGGSGVPLDRAAYEASVEYWQHHAPLIQGDPSGE